MIEDKNEQRTPLSQFGAFGLIEYLAKNIEIKHKSTIKGVGDDAAVLDFENKKTVLASQIFVENVHFDLTYMPLKHLGYKAVVAVLSKIIAMNAKPTQVGVSMAVSNRFTLEAIEAIFEGVILAAKIYKLDIINTDVTSSEKGLIISTSVVGEAIASELVYQTGAEEHDLLVVSGDIGSAYMGLQILEREKQVFKVNPNSQPDLEQYSYLLERQIKPEAPKDIKKLFDELKIKPTSMIALSNGLATDLIRLCKASQVGSIIYEDKLPMDPQFIQTCEEFAINSTTIAINGSEDYGLLFTVKITDFDKIKGNPNFSIIGHITQKENGNVLSTSDNTKMTLKSMAWSDINS